MQISETIFRQADIFLSAMLTGVALLLGYDLLRILRRILPHGTIWVALEDILFWFLSGIIIFIMLFREDSGSLRGFSIGGVVLGMLLYHFGISDYVVKGCTFLVEKILYVLLFPFVILGRKLRRPAGKIFRKIRKVLRFLKKQLKKFCKAVKIGL